MQEQMYDAAVAHYMRGETMESIARRLNVSRSTVSRLLQAARTSGMVQFTVTPPVSESPHGRRLAEQFGITVHTAVARPEMTDGERLAIVCQLAGQIVTDELRRRRGQVLGLAWGLTVSEFVRQLMPDTTVTPTIVQLNGAANARTFGIPYAMRILSQAAEKLNGHLVEFPVPAFFDRRETKELMWQERSVQRVLDIQRSVDLAVFGIGSFHGPLTSHVYAANYLDDHEFQILRQDGVVGDVCTVMLREDGSWKDIEINARASGINPDGLKQLPKRLFIVGSPARSAALVAALRAGVITDLVLDEQTAIAACQRLDRGGRKR